MSEPPGEPSQIFGPNGPVGEERDQARERFSDNAREQAELDRIGAMRPAAMRV